MPTRAHALQAIELDAARDRLKPQLDLVGSYTARGVAGARSADVMPFPGLPVEFPEELQGALGASLESVALQRFPDFTAGVVLTIPLGYRAARADIATAESAAPADRARRASASASRSPSRSATPPPRSRPRRSGSRPRAPRATPPRSSCGPRRIASPPAPPRRSSC